MTQTPIDPFTENIPAYVLGALNRTEASALQAHLETCEVCRAELAAYQQIGDGLLASVLPLQKPSSTAQRKLFHQLEEEETPAVSQGRRRFWQVALGTMILLLISTNLIAFQQIGALRKQQAQLASQLEKNHNILGVLAASTEVHPISGSGFSGNLLFDREKNLSYLLLWNLPLPPQDRVYQIWLVSPNGERVDAGSFRPELERPLTSTALLPTGNFAEFVGIEVTLEPVGGSDTPTGDQILSVGY
jgi:anti-sigma-K factor RskA